MDTRINTGPIGPALPQAGAAAVPDAAAPQNAPPAQGPAITADVAAANAGMQWEMTDVNLENIDLQEFKALDGMMQNFLQDGKITAEEWKTYDKTRVFYAEGAQHAEPAPPTGGGHPTTPPAPPAPVGGGNHWEVGDKPITGRKFSSVGDPHETTGDGLKFDNMAVGDFVKLQSASGDFVLQTRQEPWVKNPKATVNTMAAMKLGNDTVVFDGKSNSITVNGQKVDLKPGQEMKLPDGGSLKATKDGIEVTSAKGDKVTVQDKGTYIDVTGEVGPNRKDGEIRGSLGNFDNDTDKSNELMGRNGTKNFGKDVDGFIEEWRAKNGESLLPGDPPGGGARADEEAKFRAADEAEFDKMDITDDGWLSGTEKRGYEKYDMDGDGEITKAEFLSGREQERIAERDFMLKDINNDGYLSGNEIPADIRKYDKDGNGRVTKEEYVQGRLGERQLAPQGGTAARPNDPRVSWMWTALLNVRFDRQDRNDDGEISRGEALRNKRGLARRIADAKFQAMDADGNGKVSKDEFSQFQTNRAMRPFNNRDRNNDGAVSRSEYLRGSNGFDRIIRDLRFQAMDANKDGKIDSQEFTQIKAQNAFRRDLDGLAFRLPMLQERMRWLGL